MMIVGVVSTSSSVLYITKNRNCIFLKFLNSTQGQIKTLKLKNGNKYNR